MKKCALLLLAIIGLMSGASLYGVEAPYPDPSLSRHSGPTTNIESRFTFSIPFIPRYI